MPVKIQFEFNKEDKARLAKKLETLAGQVQYGAIMDRGILKLQTDTIGRTPKKTGLARRSFFVRRLDETARMLYNKIPYVKGLEEGTEAHIIRPVHAKALAWRPTKGSKAVKFAVEIKRTTNKLTGAKLKTPKTEFIIFAKKVNHPGTRPYNMIKNSLRETRDYITAEIQKFIGGTWSTK